MNRRQLLRMSAGGVSLAIASSLWPNRKQQALAEKLSLSSDDVYWLTAKPWLKMLGAAMGAKASDYTKSEGPYKISPQTWAEINKTYPDIWLAGEPITSPANHDRCALALSHQSGASDALLAGVSVEQAHLSVSYEAFKRAIALDSTRWYSPHSRSIEWLWGEYQWHLWGSCGYRRRITPPLERMEITSPFGQRWGRLHGGIDLAAANGTPVRSPENATVIKTGSDGRSGLYMVLSPEGYPEMEQAYCHLSQVNVSADDTVPAGAVIGLSGSTGKVTGPHLHLGVWAGGGIIDPYRYLMMAEWFKEGQK